MAELIYRVKYLQNYIITRAKQTFKAYDALNESSMGFQTDNKQHTRSWRYLMDRFASRTRNASQRSRQNKNTRFYPHAQLYQNLPFVV